MIRVNLLPHAAERRAAPEGSQTWLLIVMGVVVAVIIALFFFHQTKQDELAGLTADVQKYQNQINEINDLVKDHTKIKEALAVLRAREDAIAKLLAGRKGPTAVLLELSRVLTRGKGPTADPVKLEKMREDNPLNVFNPTWDPRRVWLTKYEEAERKVTIKGIAKDGGDVYEFSQRLKLSQYFEAVKLLQGKKSRENENKIELVDFALEVKVKY